ncbi:MAG: hypothetical protein MK008_13925 [Bdellovibrionales bacterium]|nr:hypothetical protein [Bdellovibrionales bacterium]
MLRIIKIMILQILMVIFCFQSTQVYAQNQNMNPNKQVTSGPKKQLATIIFSGLAGAILGLSTLSFYGRPQDKLPNIAVGAAIGIIAGTVYTTYKAATEPYRYLEADQIYFYEKRMQPVKPVVPTLAYSVSF